MMTDEKQATYGNTHSKSRIDSKYLQSANFRMDG
jgi:hypothetical protein